MDAIEAARQKASQLHDFAVAAGNDNLSLLRFVIAEALRRKLEVYPVQKGDPQLKGGRALFDSQAWFILYEDIGSDFDKAFLIAHEIGHVELEGGDYDSVAENVEPDRAAEAPAIGAERVVDYGHRERREVTMDLFAREFLLPRTVLKSCHIEEGLSSVEIANRFSAPITVVQQQLIDALLLPTISQKPLDRIAPSVAPDPHQEVAASHRDTPFQLQAGPGTGKTKTLVRRIERLLEDDVDPGSILVLTFSNKAAGELRNRIAAKFPEAVATVWLGTFHSFGLDIIHRFHDRLGLSENPRVITRYEAIEMMEDELARLPLKHFRNLYDPTLDLSDMLSAVSRAKDEVVSAKHYKMLSEAMVVNAIDDRQREQAEKCLDVANLFEVYEKLLLTQDSVDFGDLVSMPVNLVENDELVRKLLSERHQHILVDEYQDVNRASVRLLKAIAGDGNQLWVVGDSRQSIYRFRGASSINMKRFSEDFPGACVSELATNYRSVGEVVDIYRQFSLSMKASEGAIPLQLSANRGLSNELPEFRVAKTADDEIAAIAAAVTEKQQQGFAYKDQAVLCASNNRLSEIAATFEKLGIPVLHLGSLFEREDVKDILSILSLVTDRHAVGLIRVVTQPNFELPMDQVLLLQQHVRGSSDEPMAWGGQVNEVQGLSEQSRVVFKRISDALDGFPVHSNPWPILATLIIDRLGLAKQAALAEDLKGKMSGIALWQLLNFCRKSIVGKGLPIDRLLSRIRNIVLLSEDREMRQLPQVALGMDGIRLMTIHASKGLEFKVVHLPGLISTGLPANNRPPRCLPPDGMIEGSEGLTGLEAIKAGHEEEEECKFFVAVSRAEDRLLLYASSVLNNGNRRSESRYIKRIEASVQRNNTPPLQLIPAIPYENILVETDGLDITTKQLSLYDRCARRFLYTHVLGLSGKRTESAFMRMYSVVYEVLEWLATHHSESTPSLPELETQFMHSWDNKGPVDHGYAEDYRRIGKGLVDYLIETRKGCTLVKPETISLSFSSGAISVFPDEITLDTDGRYTLRRIKTGKKSKDEHDQIEYSLLLEAAEQHFGAGSRVESVHLASETREQVRVTSRKKATRLEKTQIVLSAIASGHFPAKPDNRSCPRCPSFFICGKVPKGQIKI